MAKSRLPDLPAGAPGRPPRNRYRRQYGLIIVCRSEAEQKALYKQLRARRLEVRVVVT